MLQYSCVTDRVLTWLYVLFNNTDMCVSVGSCVFMPEANHVTQLVNHNAKFIAVLANGDSLGSITPPTHIRTTSKNKQANKNIASEIHIVRLRS